MLQIKQNEKLRVVTRRDLPLNVQAVQATHAAIDFQHQHSVEAINWHTQSNFLALLTVKSEHELDKLISKAIFLDIKHTVFREPDLDNQITAVAFEASDNSRKLTSSCPLLGKE